MVSPHLILEKRAAAVKTNSNPLQQFQMVKGNSLGNRSEGRKLQGRTGSQKPKAPLRPLKSLQRDRVTAKLEIVAGTLLKKDKYLLAGKLNGKKKIQGHSTPPPQI